MIKKYPRLLAMLLVAGITISSNTSFASDMMKKEGETTEPKKMEMTKMETATEDRLELEALLATMKQETKQLTTTLADLEKQHHTAKENDEKEKMMALEAEIASTKEAIKAKHTDFLTAMKALKKAVHLEIDSETLMKNMKLKKEISKMFPDIKVMSPEDLYSKGHKFNLNAPLVMIDYKIMVPVKGMAEAYKATIEWHAETKSVTMKKGDLTVKLHLGSNMAHVNDKEVMLDSVVVSMKGNMYGPLNFMAEMLGLESEYHESIQMIELKHKDITAEKKTASEPTPQGAEAKAEEHVH